MERPGLGPALSKARRALKAAPAGILSDLDGTLSPIVADPAAARALPGAAEALRALAKGGVLTGIVSGRAAADVRRILATDELLVVGNHGLEWLEAGEVEPIPTPELDAARQAIERLLRHVPDEPGVTVEHKGLSATVHFRNAHDPAVAGARVRQALAAAALPGVEVRSGRMSLELRPVGGGDKGTAVHAVVERYGLRGLVVLGDDVTDLDMFRAAAQLRAAARLEAAILGVAGGREVPPEVREAADLVLPDPESVVWLLRALA
jgi:trehalose 6-phosphate phosphatase